MSQGNDFANYSAAASSGPTGAEDVWFVAVASDDIKQMNVDQLDEAFRLGVITAETAVWTEGMEAWAPLGQVADLEGSSEESGPASAGAAHTGHHDNHPAARDYHSVRHDDIDARNDRRREPDQREAPATLPPVGNASFGNASFGNASFGQASANHASAGHGGGFASTPHSFSPGPNSISPVTSSYAPTANGGPVALNVDEDMPSIRHGRRFRPERWALAAAALVAIGVVGYNNMFSSSVASAGTQAPVAAAAPVASRAYDDGVEAGEKLTAKASATEQPQAAAAPADEEASKPSEAKSAAAKPSAAADDADDDTPASTKGKAADKESLKGSFSKAFNKKAPAAKAVKVKPRKAAMRATTKARATKSTKKAGVAREKSAFDPLNDSLP
jgi:uncharacterized protein DUF4339